MQFQLAAQLNAQPDGTFTVTAWWPNTLRRELTQTMRDAGITIGDPSQQGDVLSVQPDDGAFQVRPPGTHGAFEVCTVSGVTLLYRVGDRVNWLIPDGA